MQNKLSKLALTGKLEVKLAEPDVETSQKSFSGYGAAFNNTDFAGDIIAPGAFAKTLEEHNSAGTAPQMFFNHDGYSMPIGVWSELAEDDYGLKVTGTFLDTSAGRDAYAAVKAGAVSGLSIGYFATEFQTDGNIRTITEAKLVEISVVTFPCNTLARIGEVKSMNEDDDFLAKLAELGVDDEDAKALLAKRNKSVDVSEEAEAEADEEFDEGEPTNDDESETKYTKTARFEAVSNMILKIREIK